MAQQAKTVCSRSTSTKEAEEGFQLGSLGVDFELISCGRSRLAALEGDQRAVGRGVSRRRQCHGILWVSRMRTHPPYPQAVRSCRGGLLGRFLLKPHKWNNLEKQHYFTSGTAKGQAPSGRVLSLPKTISVQPLYPLLPNTTEGCFWPRAAAGTGGGTLTSRGPLPPALHTCDTRAQPDRSLPC